MNGNRMKILKNIENIEKILDVLSKHINIGNIYRPPKDLLENYYEFINDF